MSKRTLIYLHPADPLHVSWIIARDGVIENTVLQGELVHLPLYAKQNEIIVIVPAEDVLLTSVALPKLSRARLLQALPFAIEEQLIDNLSELHFAIADTQSDGTVPVAIVAKQKIEHWLTYLKQFDIIPTQLLSAVFTLPYAEKNWSLAITPQQVIVRQGRYAGFASERYNLDLLLTQALAETKMPPECLQVYHTDTMPSSLAIATNDIPLSEQAYLEQSFTTLQNTPSINLLQATYQPKRKASDTKKYWLWSAYATVLWIILAFIGQSISFFILHHQVNRYENDIQTIYHKHFPQATHVVAPRERLENKFKKMHEAANKNYFLTLLAQISPVLHQTPHIKLNMFDFRDNQFNLDITASTFNDLDIFKKALLQQGLIVKQQNAAITSGSAVKANITVQRNSS